MEQPVVVNSDKKKGRGCLFYGCLTVIVIALLMGGLVTYGLWKLKEVGLGYTDREPLMFETETASPERVEEIKDKIEGFHTAVKNGEGEGYLSLSAEEVNALINSYHLFEGQGGGIRVSFEEERIQGQVSLPLEGLPLGLGEGRYLNGSATFKVWCEGGLLVLTVDSLEVKGRQIPEIVMSEIRKANLAKDMYKDADRAKMLRRLKRVEVQEGKLLIEVEPERM